MRIESRFKSSEWTDDNCKEAVRLFLTNAEVTEYNARVLVGRSSVEDCPAYDRYTGFMCPAERADAEKRVEKNWATITLLCSAKFERSC